MIQSDDLKLLAELSRVVAKHDSGSLIRLANLIRDPKSADDLATVLESVAKQFGKPRAPKERRSHNFRKTDGTGMGVLNELRETEPEKHATLVEFRDRLVSGALLQSMREVRQFALMHDLKIGNAKSRNAAIAPLLRSIAERDMLAIAELLGSATEFGPSGRSLEEWRDVIVKPLPVQGPENRGEAVR